MHSFSLDVHTDFSHVRVHFFGRPDDGRLWLRLLDAAARACSRGEEAGGAAGSRPIGVEAAGVLTSSVQRRQPSGGGGHDGSGLQSGGGRHPGGGVGQFGGGLNLTITSTNIQRESHRIPYPRNGQDDD